MYEIDTPLWLRANLAAVWCTDGEVSLLDVLGSEFIDANSKKMSAVLNGMGGDPIHGGTLLDIKNDPDYPLRERYEDEDRRWIRPGFRLAESFYPVRMPFYDNALVELTMSIPEALRKGSFIYKRILLQNFPQYFHAIPWQKTGLPISFPPFAEKIALFCKRAKSKAARAAYRHGIPIQDSMHTVNKRRRTVAEPGRTFLWKLFVSQNALYPDYVNKDLVLSTWKRHLRGQDATAIVNRYATFEIWLRQAFSKTLRPEPESFPLVETGSL
jgi:asparagine synthetase B (glutamine-hydrolysing)